MRCRTAFLPGLLLVAVVLGGCAGGSDESLDRACLDNRDRAFGAAEKVRQHAATNAADDEDVREWMSTYIAEVQRVPECFAEEVRTQVAEADTALKKGQILDLGPRPPAIEG